MVQSERVQLTKKDISKLEVGDEILNADESVTVVKSIKYHAQKNAEKYNLSVGGDSTFTANGLVVRAFKTNTNY